MLEKLENESVNFEQKLSDLHVKYNDLKVKYKHLKKTKTILQNQNSKL